MPLGGATKRFSPLSSVEASLHLCLRHEARREAEIAVSSLLVLCTNSGRPAPRTSRARSRVRGEIEGSKGGFRIALV